MGIYGRQSHDAAKLLAALGFVELLFYGKKRQVFIHIGVFFLSFPGAHAERSAHAVPEWATCG